MSEEIRQFYDNTKNSLYYKKTVFLDPGIANNAFSNTRKRDRNPLEISPLKIAAFEELTVGKHVAFQDFDGDDWMECKGLESALLSFESGIPVYIFDNHNHAFYAWCEGLKASVFQSGAQLVHLDAHFDDSVPENTNVNLDDLQSVWGYTNKTLQIASFIKPALDLGIFSKVLNYVESRDFTALPDLSNEQEIVLDIDLDVFCDEMSHVTWSEKVNVIKHFLPNTKLVTMATSPFFIDQQRAIDIAKRLMKDVFCA
jgi:hypothetical protein